MSNLTSYGSKKQQILAEKRVFFDKSRIQWPLSLLYVF